MSAESEQALKRDWESDRRDRSHRERPQDRQVPAGRAHDSNPSTVRQREEDLCEFQDTQGCTVRQKMNFLAHILAIHEKRET